MKQAQGHLGWSLQSVRLSRSSTGRSGFKRVAGCGTVAGVGLAVLLAACGGGGSKASTAPPSTAASAAANGASTAGSSTAATVVAERVPKKREILANAKDRTLYTYTADKGGKSACTGACLTYWPPLLLPSGTTQPVAGPGVSGLGTEPSRVVSQVTYHGMPLYTYIGDKAPNQTTGQGVVDSLGTWYVVSLSGSASARRPRPAKP